MELASNLSFESRWISLFLVEEEHVCSGDWTGPRKVNITKINNK
jgi:hypothetical protein